MSDVSIQLLEVGNIAAITAAVAALGWRRAAGHHERYLEEQRHGEREVLVAWQRNEFAGYVTILWQSYYSPFSATRASRRSVISTCRDPCDGVASGRDC